MYAYSKTVNKGRIDWLTNRILDISIDGLKIAYLSARNKTTNIFIKDLNRQGGSIQRTNRSAVLDFHSHQMVNTSASQKCEGI